MQRFAEAEDDLRHALAVIGAKPGAVSAEIGWSAYTLGMVLYAEEKVREAQAYLERALPIQEKLLAPNDPDLSTLFETLGEIQGAAGELAAGEKNTRRALVLREHALGPHELTGWSAYYLAATLYTEHKYSEALSVLLSSQRDMQKFEPSRHLRIAIEVLLALSYQQQHQEVLAQEHIRSARALCAGTREPKAAAICAVAGQFGS